MNLPDMLDLLAFGSMLVGQVTSNGDRKSLVKRNKIFSLENAILHMSKSTSHVANLSYLSLFDRGRAN